MVRRLNSSPIKILDYCQIVFVGVQVNLINILNLLTSCLPIASNLSVILRIHHANNHTLSEINLYRPWDGCIHQQRCEQIIILNKIFIDNPILSPILVFNYERKQA